MKSDHQRFDKRHGHETRELLIDIWGLVTSYKARRREKANKIRERKQAERRRALHYREEMTEQEYYDSQYKDKG